uniref:Uncharacterized protein n=1 Tax=Anguilla anguilla TaxID=7936 RepID=A0A0E9S6Z8_ANGAN
MRQMLRRKYTRERLAREQNVTFQHTNSAREQSQQACQ